MNPSLSFSKLELAELCPGALVLFQVDRENPARRRGTAVHAFLREVSRIDREQALQSVPEEHREACAALDLDLLPLDPESWAAEVAFAYDVETDQARELGRDLERNYPEVGDDEIVGTADLVGLDADRVIVPDFKTGRVPPPVKGNLQLGAYALAAARAYQRSAAKVAIIHLPMGFSDIDPSCRSADLDSIDLDAIGARIYGIWESLRAARTAYAQGQLPFLCEGDHCVYCAAFPTCPAKQVLASRIAKPELCPAVLAVAQDLEAFRNALTLESAPGIIAMLERYDELSKRLWAIIDDLAKQAPIPLGNGEAYGPHPYTRTRISGDAISVLLDRYGEEVALVAAKSVEATLTKKAITDALRPWVKTKEGAKISWEMDACMEALIQRGAAKKSTSTPIGRYTLREERQEEAQ